MTIVAACIRAALELQCLKILFVTTVAVRKAVSGRRRVLSTKNDVDIKSTVPHLPLMRGK